MISIEKSRGLSVLYLDKLADDHYNRLLKKVKGGNLESRLITLLSKKKSTRKIKILKYISKNLKKIIVSHPDELYRMSRYIENNLGLRHDKLLKCEIEKVFGYSNFRSNNNAVMLNESLKIKTCLYCNSQYSLTILKTTKDKKLLYEFDHYFDKAYFPYLSVSFFNLIPSCANCNKSKTNKKFNFKTYFHPYIGKSLDDICYFSLNNIDVVKHFNGSPQPIQIGLKSRNNLPDEMKIFDNHIEVFSIGSLYANHADIGKDLLLKSYAYTTKRKTELMKMKDGVGNSLFTSIHELNLFLVGNYTQKADYLKRPLSKMMADISRELKLI